MTSPQRTTAVTLLGALGVVFGDIGTSPLYALRTMLGEAGPLDGTAILGMTSLVVWTLVMVVTVLYVGTLLRHDNEGEGGLLALVTLLRGRGGRTRLVAVTVLGMVGAALFLGDSVITPAISVLSASEGLEVAAPGASSWVVPIALVLLLGVFVSQRAGSGTIGKFYGPVMLVWFLVLALTGLLSLVRTPEILGALSPLDAVHFLAQRPVTGFFSLGAVILAVTGAEALFADLSHFGRAAITRCWLGLVLPSLVLAYLGESAAVMRDHGAKAEPFYAVVPHWATIPVLVLATAATVIASEAVIAGAFTVVHQAGGLKLLPYLRTLHPSRDQAAQVYLPVANVLLGLAVLAMVVVFRSSAALSDAYGVAVAGTFLVTVSLLLLLGEQRVVAVVSMVVVLAFAGAVVPKIATGGYVPLTIAAVLLALMLSWWTGERRLQRARECDEVDLDDVAGLLREAGPRRAGVTVFLTGDPRVAPVGLRSLLDAGYRPAEHVVLLSWYVEDRPGARPSSPHVRLVRPEHPTPGLVSIEVGLGYRERLDVRHVLRDAKQEVPDALHDVDAGRAWYVVSQPVARPSSRGPAAVWQRLFVLMARLSTDRAGQLELPRERTLVVGREFEL